MQSVHGYGIYRMQGKGGGAARKLEVARVAALTVGAPYLGYRSLRGDPDSSGHHSGRCRSFRINQRIHHTSTTPIRLGTDAGGWI